MADVPGAYPLTVVTYAATKPLSLDATGRTEYAAFLDYAAGPGQVSGSEYGELPSGYLPLPAELRSRTTAAAVEVRTMAAPSPTTTTPPPAAVEPASVVVSSQPSAAGGGAGAVGSSAASTTSGGRPSSGSPGSSASSGSSGSSAQPTGEVAPETTVEVPSSEVPDTTVSSSSATSDRSVPPTTAAQVAMTPASDPGTSRFVVVGVGVLAIAGALGSLEITKRTRRIPAAIGSLEQVHGV